jgi:transcriptional regulator with XRE-family HTH domain
MNNREEKAITIRSEVISKRVLLMLTQGELAEKLGVALNTVSRWETGKSIPSLKNQRKLRNMVSTVK